MLCTPPGTGPAHPGAQEKLPEQGHREEGQVPGGLKALSSPPPLASLRWSWGGASTGQEGWGLSFLKDWALAVCLQDHTCARAHMRVCVCEPQVSTQMQAWEASGDKRPAGQVTPGKMIWRTWCWPRPRWREGPLCPGAWAALGTQGVGLGGPGEGRCWVCPAATPATQHKGPRHQGPGEWAVGASWIDPGPQATLTLPGSSFHLAWPALLYPNNLSVTQSLAVMAASSEKPPVTPALEVWCCPCLWGPTFCPTTVRPPTGPREQSPARFAGLMTIPA